jgi:hypothetical protein
MPRPRMTVRPIAPRYPESAAAVDLEGVLAVGRRDAGHVDALALLTQRVEQNVVGGPTVTTPGMRAIRRSTSSSTSCRRVESYRSAGNRKPEHAGRRSAEPGIDRRARLEAFEKQQGSDEQRERDGHLADDERVAYREAPHGAAVGVLVLDRLDDRRARRLQRREESEQYARHRRRRDREREDAPVERHVERDGNRHWKVSAKHGPQGDARQYDAGRTAHRREEQRFDQELSNEHAALGADRQPNRYFAAPVARLREKEARQVGTRHEEHESDDDHQRRRSGYHDGIDQWVDGDVTHRNDDERRAGWPVGGKTLQHVRREVRRQRFGLSDRRAGKKASLEKCRVVPALRELITDVGLELD